jgi:hypothetical protein
MNKEYHVFTVTKNNHEQAFVFEVNREDQGVQINELWMITSVNGNEVRSCLKFDKIINTIINQVGGNVPDKNVEKLTDMFIDILSDEKKLELQEEQFHKEEIATYNLDPTILLDASYYSEILHNEHGNIQEIVQNITTNKE